jgi:D-3-phosphoglycerate dehydrogenase
LPLNSETKNLINKSNLLLLKNNATIINTARGGVINENDLFDFLNQNSLAYAALDCFEEEPYNGKLLNLQNIQLSAHMGSYAIESREMMEKEAIQNLIKGLI